MFNVNEDLIYVVFEFLVELVFMFVAATCTVLTQCGTTRQCSRWHVVPGHPRQPTCQPGLARSPCHGHDVVVACQVARHVQLDIYTCSISSSPQWK